MKINPAEVIEAYKATNLLPTPSSCNDTTDNQLVNYEKEYSRRSVKPSKKRIYD